LICSHMPIKAQALRYRCLLKYRSLKFFNSPKLSDTELKLKRPKPQADILNTSSDILDTSSDILDPSSDVLNLIQDLMELAWCL
jgi:hypothetical protein